jgi:hypothetical protein
MLPFTGLTGAEASSAADTEYTAPASATTAYSDTTSDDFFTILSYGNGLLNQDYLLSLLSIY